MFDFNALENPSRPTNSDLSLIADELAQRGDWTRVTVCEHARGIVLTQEQVDAHCAAFGLDRWDMTPDEARGVVGSWVAAGLDTPPSQDPPGIDLIVVDEECAGEDWWFAVQSTVPDDADAATLRRQLLAASESSVQGTSDAVDRFFAWASTLPGWLGGPEHAPHPAPSRGPAERPDGPDAPQGDEPPTARAGVPMSSPESAHLPEVRMTRKRPKMVPLHTLVESETLERIDRIAKSRGLSRAAFLRRLFLGIERVEPEPPPR